MLGRKDYTQKELDDARAAMEAQLAAYRRLVDAAASDPDVTAALEAFEPLFVQNLVLALDRRFVHRLRMVTGKDGNPLNELELLTESLLNNDGILRGNNVIKFIPDQSVLGLEIGERIEPGATEFQALVGAFLREIEARFVTAGARS
jgi:hypothetical protein